MTLVDLRESGIERFTERGIRLTNCSEIEIDAVVFATGFDAMTGSLLAVGIRGRGGLPLKERWRDGTKNYLGVTVAGFPNLFMITSPGSPSMLYHMVASIEQNVDFTLDTLEYLRRHGLASIEANPREESAWTKYVAWVSRQTIYTKVKSWYTGENVNGNPAEFMPYAGGGSRISDSLSRPWTAGIEASRWRREAHGGFCPAQAGATRFRNRKAGFSIQAQPAIRDLTSETAASRSSTDYRYRDDA